MGLRAAGHVGQERTLSRHDADGKQAALVEADRLRGETDDRFPEQGRASEQHHRQRHLTRDDETLRTAAESRQTSPRAKCVDRGNAEPASDGAIPHSSVITAQSITANSVTRVSMATVSIRGRRVGAIVTSTGVIHHAATRPATLPPTASSAFSVSI